ncbi:hypothetical protein ACFLRZ_03830 [Bacteroidota bacterium]
MKKTIITTLILLLIFTSCTRNKVFEEHHKLTNFTWKRVNSSIFFNVDIVDTDCNYDVYIAVRYIDGINLDNIETGLTIYTPDSAEYYDEYKIRIKSEDGSFRGSVAGDIWDISELVIKNMPFYKEGTYQFEIENLTGNLYETRGIMEIGLILKKSKIS